MLKFFVFLAVVAAMLWTAVAPVSGFAAPGGCAQARIAEDVCLMPLANGQENPRDTAPCATAPCQDADAEESWQADPQDVRYRPEADVPSDRSVQPSWRPPRS